MRVAFGLRCDEGRPGGRPIWRAAVENQLLLADELHPEARRAKNRPCGLGHLFLLMDVVGASVRAIGSGLYAGPAVRVNKKARTGS